MKIACKFKRKKVRQSAIEKVILPWYGSDKKIRQSAIEKVILTWYGSDTI